MGVRDTYNGDANIRLVYKKLDDSFKKLMNMEVEDILTLDIWGRKQNVGMFIINGFCFFMSSNAYKDCTYSLLCDKKDLLQQFDDSMIRDVPYIDMALYKCMIPSYVDSSLRDVLLVLLAKYPKETIRMLYYGAFSELLHVISNNATNVHLKFKHNGVCNTQAFCYYIMLYWVANIVPDMKFILGKDYAKLHLPSLLLEVCPKGSIHEQYLTGVLSSKELLDKYTTKNDKGFSPALQEVVSVSTEGSYDGQDLTLEEIHLAQDMFNLFTRSLDFNYNRCAGFAVLLNGTPKDVLNNLEAKTEEIEELNSTIQRLNARLVKANDSSEVLRTENKKLEDTIRQLKEQLSAIKIDANAVNELAELKSKYSELELENNKLFNERIKLKQEVSKQKKELKKLNVLVGDQCITEEVSCSVIDESDYFDIESAWTKLKGLHLLTIGMEFNQSLVQAFESHDVDIKQFNRNTKSIGKADLAVIFTLRCSHSEVYKLEKYAKGTNTQILYFDGSNITQLVRAILGVLENE